MCKTLEVEKKNVYFDVVNCCTKYLVLSQAKQSKSILI